MSIFFEDCVGGGVYLGKPHINNKRMSEMNIFQTCEHVPIDLHTAHETCTTSP